MQLAASFFFDIGSGSNRQKSSSEKRLQRVLWSFFVRPHGFLLFLWALGANALSRAHQLDYSSSGVTK
jgi:hypothetical protein